MTYTIGLFRASCMIRQLHSKPIVDVRRMPHKHKFRVITLEYQHQENCLIKLQLEVHSHTNGTNTIVIW